MHVPHTCWLATPIRANTKSCLHGRVLICLSGKTQVQCSLQQLYSFTIRGQHLSTGSSMPITDALVLPSAAAVAEMLQAPDSSFMCCAVPTHEHPACLPSCMPMQMVMVQQSLVSMVEFITCNCDADACNSCRPSQGAHTTSARRPSG
jgi:hypothetical protein